MRAPASNRTRGRSSIDDMMQHALQTAFAAGQRSATRRDLALWRAAAATIPGFARSLVVAEPRPPVQPQPPDEFPE